MTIDIEELTKPVSSAESTHEITRLIMLAQELHQNRCDQLQTIVTNDDKGMQFDGGEEGIVKIEAGTQLHRGVVVGVQLALSMLSDFPLKLEPTAADDDEDWEDDDADEEGE